ncbi:sigma-70 family RNA polymerase sigma factor [bacterium]|nr:MAG: sigma-70 family RNA polymerase sigma factor [bacterium]
MTTPPRPRRDPALDRRLAQAACAGDAEAFGELVAAYERPLYHFALRTLRDREEAADATQEAFVKAYRGLRTFRQELRFSTWLFAITYHACCDRLAKGRRFVLEEPPEIPDHRPGPEELALRSDIQARAQQAIARLPERYRTVVTLYYLHECSYEEMAEILSLPLGTVKTHLHRAKERLRRLLESEEPA